jgi:hypothetical protein
LASTPELKLKFDYGGPRNRGAELVERLLTTGEAPDGALSPTEAEQAVAVLEQMQSLWFVDQMVEGGERLAEQVHTETAHGLQELVQNADDHGATELRMGVRKTARETQLLVAHDGKPVDLRDVVLMAYALLSGSREDPERIGRFGIGLKTLNQISESMSVHCPPFRGAEISGGKIHPVKAPKPIKGFWSPQKRETLFILRLRDTAPDRKWFVRWLTDWDASSLLFLRTLRRVAFLDLRGRKVLAEQGLAAENDATKLRLEIRGGEDAERVALRGAAGTRRWTRYTVRYPAPRDLRRAHKALGKTVPLSIAVPERGPSVGRLFAGLPLDEPTRLPLSLAAPFDINVSRTEVREQPSGFNGWLLDRLADLVVAAALQRFQERPKDGWRAVPVEDETAGEEWGWLEKHTEKLITRIHERLQSRLRLRLGRGLVVRVEEIVFEDQALDGLLSEADQERLDDADRHALPKRHRDGGRWRKVLWDLGGARIDAKQALQILDWDDDHRPRTPAWLVELAAAAISAEADDALFEKPWIVPAGSRERLSPRQVSERRVLLVHGGGTKGLGARLNQTQPLARPFLAAKPGAERVRKWLTQREVLRRHPTDEDALAALARGDGSDPIDLRRDQRLLLRLRDAFGELDPESQRTLGPGIGRNVQLRGYTWKGGQRRARKVTPASAYLPSAIEKHEGWLRAAAKCDGLNWIHGDYGTILRVPRTSRRPGALAFLRALGAGVAPRLERVDEEGELVEIDQKKLSTHQREELLEFPKAAHLIDDWISPDLDLVIADILRERAGRERRTRARALFLALHNNWRDYADRTEATASYFRYQQRDLGPISATWIGRAASEPWLTTKEKGVHPRAPRELIIDTGTTLGDADPSQFADEIEAQYAESAAAEALGLKGRISAEDLVDALEKMRETEGEVISQARVNQVYSALATYCPGGENEARSDLSVRQLQARFGRPSARQGLFYVGGQWLPPANVRRGPNLGERIPRVEGAEGLWEALGVDEPDIGDCLRFLQRMAKERAEDRAVEFQLFRHLLAVVPRQRSRRKELARAPLRTSQGWKSERPIFAVANPSLAGALASSMPIWEVPLPVEELDPILGLLAVEPIDESRFEPRVSSLAVAAGDALTPAWMRAVAHFREFLAVYRPDLEEALGVEGWRALTDCRIALGTDWDVRVPRPGKRAVSVQVPAFIFREVPLLFCAIGEDYAESLDAGGQAVASLFAHSELKGSDRVFLAMAWESAFRRREEHATELDLPLEEEGTEGGLELSKLPVRTGRAGRRRPRRRQGKGRGETTAETRARQLIDPDDIDLKKVKVSEAAAAGGGGKLRITARRPLKRAAQARRRPSLPSSRQALSDQDREDVGYRLMERWLADRGIDIDDTRNQPNVGADGVDLEQDLYFELKAHAGEAGNVVRLQSSEAERAREKKDRYWLVIASGLEEGSEQELLFIPDPLKRLNIQFRGGINLTGINSVSGRRPRGRSRS